MRAHCIALLGLGLALLAAQALAEESFPGTPHVESVFPRGWHQGGEVEVEISGRRLEDVKSVLFYGPGLSAVELKPLEESSYTKNGKKEKKRLKRGEGLRAKFRIAVDCAPGEQVLRVLTASGLSDAATFWVGTLPTVAEQEREIYRGDLNSKPENAEPIAMNSTVNGLLIAHDRDVYRVPVKKGQLVSAEIEAARLGTYGRYDFPDLELELLDGGGNRLAYSSDSALLLEDPFLSVRAPADGDVFVAVREEVPTGSRRLAYRLHVGDFARPAMLYPAGGRVGETLKARVIGAPGVDETTVALPGKPGWFEPRPKGGPPTPNKLLVSEHPNVLEREPNDKPASATVAGEFPAAFNGIIERSGDVDVFGFRARKGDRFRVRLYGQALGSPIDATMWVASLDGKRAKRKKGVDDSDAEDLGRFGADSVRWELDPATTFEAEEDGDYVLGVEDRRGMGGPEFVYRIEFERERDALFTYLPQAVNNAPSFRDRIQIGRGGSYQAIVGWKPAPGVEIEGPLVVDAEGLPSGVTMEAPPVTAGMTRIPVVFKAAAGAPIGAGLVRLTVQPKEGRARAEFSQTLKFFQVSGNYAMHQVFVDRLAVAVTEEVPFRIEVQAPTIALTPNGELDIPVKVHRRPGFDREIELFTEWLPSGANRPTPVVVPPGQSQAVYTIGAGSRCETGEWRTAITAQTRKGDRRTGEGYYFVSSSLFDLRTEQPYLSVKIARASVESGKTREIVCTLGHDRPFPGAASASLGRLPKGVELLGGRVPIERGDKQIVFTVRATDKALVGMYRGIFCDLEFKHQGQIVRQRSGYGMLRVDPARGVVKR